MRRWKRQLATSAFSHPLHPSSVSNSFSIPSSYILLLRQLTCPVCSPVCMWNVDHTEIWRTETWSISHVVPATHPQNSLVPSCNQCWRDCSQMEQEDLTSHIHRRRAAVFGNRTRPSTTWGGARSDGYATGSRHASWRPSRQQPTSDDQDDRDTPGFDKWRSTPVSPPMLHGTLPSTAAVGGRYRELDTSATRHFGTVKLVPKFKTNHRWSCVSSELSWVEVSRLFLDHGTRVEVSRTTFLVSKCLEIGAEVSQSVLMPKYLVVTHVTWMVSLKSVTFQLKTLSIFCFGTTLDQTLLYNEHFHALLPS